MNLHFFDSHLHEADVINSPEAHAASWALKQVLRKALSFTELQGSNHLLRGSSKDRGNTFISGHYSYFSAVTVHFNDCSLTNRNQHAEEPDLKNEYFSYPSEGKDGVMS